MDSIGRVQSALHMSQVNIIIVVGEISSVPDKTSLISHVKDGILVVFVTLAFSILSLFQRWLFIHRLLHRVICTDVDFKFLRQITMLDPMMCAPL